MGYQMPVCPFKLELLVDGNATVIPHQGNPNQDSA